MSPTGFLFVDSEHDQSYELAQILLITAKVQTQKLTRVSAMVVVLYDMMLTMDKEIEFFWKQRWSTVKLIYMLNRYGGLFFVLVDTWGKSCFLPPNYLLNQACTFQFYFQQWTGWISVLLVEIILIIRVNTLYERSRKSTVLLAFFFVIQAGIMAAVLSIFDSVTEIFVWVAVNTCGSYEAPPKWVAIFWLPPVIMDFGLLVLTFRKALAIRRMMPGNNWRDFQLHRTLVRDQALYFTGGTRILICSLTNMAFLAFSSSLLCDALGFALGFPCVMGSRILLNLRETARGKPMTSLALTSLRFADNPGMQPVGLSGEISLPEDNDDDDSLPTSFESTGLFEDII
ncbi:hypothetical protein M0805_007803 [Coniferiporia weirii]|nr:hypothetical protein M0805_007803 [Coniferiporia weirii]